MSFASCNDQHCITCADEGVLMRVRSVVDGVAACVGPHGEESEVLTELVEPVLPGDLLLVHAGAALVKLTVANGAA